VPADKLSASQIRKHQQKATALLDGHLKVRGKGSLQEASLFPISNIWRNRSTQTSG
jgi:hypothetical protein